MSEPEPGARARASQESDDGALEELLDEVADRCRRGERPSVTELTERYPRLAERIREVFPALQFLGDLAPTEGADRASSPESGIDGPLPGSWRLGEYRLLREIGRGGMGVVYEAEQESLGRRVALKVLPFHSMANERFLERFRREARAAGGLEHPNIVPVHGLGEDSGVHYYAMQFIDGVGLDGVIEQVTWLTGGEGSSAGAGGEARERGAPLKTAATSGILLGWSRPNSVDEFDAGRATSSVDTSSLATSEDPSITNAPRAPGTTGAESDAATSELPLPGLSADDLADLRSSRLPATYYLGVAQIGLQVAEALAYAHARGVLHRDIKPSNLLVSPDGRAWVADFGLAKVDSSDDLTGSGELVGTLRYMAPERFEGRCDALSDVYGLGLTLYEILTLQPAFQGTSRTQLIKQITSSEPTRPRRLDRRIPRPLETIVLKATAPVPEERYASAAEMAADLRRYVEGRQILARLPRLRGRMGRRVRRHPVWTALILACLALLSALFAFWLEPDRQLVANGFAVGDLDGDGRPDLALAVAEDYRSEYRGEIQIFLNEGEGGLDRHARLETGDWPFAVATGDFDGDGDRDLAVSNHRSGQLAFVLNDGHGTFEQARVVEFENNLMRLAAADFNGDGSSEVATTVLGSARVYIVGGPEAGTGASPPVEVPVAGAPDSLAVSDLDGDGSPDIVTANARERSVSVLLNTGDGLFRPEREYPVDAIDDEIVDWPVDAVVADLDGTERPDLVLVIAEQSTEPGFVILRNRGDGTFRDPERVSTPMWLGAFAPADFDEDGDIDLVGVGDVSSVCLFENDHGSLAEPLGLAEANRPTCVRAAHMDGDGHIDLVVGDQGWIRVLVNDGHGGFRAHPAGRLHTGLLHWLKQELARLLDDA